ncbi:uncharacterized protein LOC135390483 [Ornithodoros turicata]|uniref:uncharacterized protein LOC135390483 n=1 Tax=Ornithodoros turicata TaxID=34597 RepID=UPI00313A4D38
MSQSHPAPKLGTMAEFNTKVDDVRSYFERFDNYVDINGVPQEKKLKLLLNVIGGQAYEELKKIVVPALPTEKTHGEIKVLLEGHYSPQRSIIAERCQFNRRVQHPDETVKDFITELKHLARDRELGTFLNDALRDRLVAGLRDEETQRTLFATEKLTFEVACKIALEKELRSEANEAVTRRKPRRWSQRYQWESKEEGSKMESSRTGRRQ